MFTTPAEGPGTRAVTVLECTFASSSRVGKAGAARGRHFQPIDQNG